MHDAAFVHVGERVAEAAGEFQRIGFRQRPDVVEQMRERVAAQIFGDDVGPAALFDWDEFQQVRMIELPADVFLALETGVKAGIAFKLQERHFDGDGLIGLLVGGFENRGHAAATDDFGDVKPVVECLPRLHVAAAHHVGRRVIRRHAPVKRDGFDFVNLDDLNAEIVVSAALLGERDELPAGLRGRVARDDVANLVVSDVRVQAVGTKHNPVAFENLNFVGIHTRNRLLADAAGQERTLIAGLGFLVGNQPELALHSDVGMVGSELLHFGFADEVNAGITDIADRDLIIAEHRHGHRGGHAPAGIPERQAFVIDGDIGGVDGFDDEISGGVAGFGFAESFQAGLDGQPAGDFAMVLAADAVAQNCDRAALAFFLDVIRLPEANEIFVVLACRPRRRKFCVGQVHGWIG